MSTLAIEQRVTPEQLMRLPDRNGFELVDGQLVERPVSKESSRIGAEIVTCLAIEARRTGEAEVYGADLGYQCFGESDHIRKPDASVIRRERLSQIPGDVGYMPIPADLAVEVLSPNDLAREVSRKIEEYLAAGFALVWVVDPEARLIQIHRADGSVSKLHEKDQITGEAALPAFRCRVGDLLAAQTQTPASA
jgi:Uma2 family endonuclease